MKFIKKLIRNKIMQWNEIIDLYLYGIDDEY